MSNPFAVGKRAFGFCDRCAARSPLHELKTEMVRARPTGSRVCRSCWDLDHPQNFLGMVPVKDPQALRNPRPDNSLQESRELIPGPYTIDDIP